MTSNGVGKQLSTRPSRIWNAWFERPARGYRKVNINKTLNFIGE